MSETEIDPASSPLASDHLLPDCRYGSVYMAIQGYLDEALGTEEEDGAGEGLEGDVRLLGQQRDEARAALAAAHAKLDRLHAAVTDGTAAEIRSATDALLTGGAR